MKTSPISVWSSLVMALLATAPSRAGANDDTSPPALTLTLVAERPAIVPGQTFALGLFLEHAPDHHSYWKSPGIVGVPTSLDWTLPEGFTAGPLQWPIPQLVDMRGHGAYGYRDDTLLVVDISPPTGLTPGARVTLRARAGYLCCSQERCVPGFEDLAITLPVQPPGDPNGLNPKWRRAFERSRAQFPLPAPGWSGTARNIDNRYEVVLKVPEDIPVPESDDLYWFSSNGLISSEERQVIKCASDEIQLTLVKHPFADPDAARFEGLLVSKSGWEPGAGKRQGLFIAVPLSSERPSKSAPGSSANEGSSETPNVTLESLKTQSRSK